MWLEEKDYIYRMVEGGKMDGFEGELDDGVGWVEGMKSEEVDCLGIGI